MDLVPGLEGVPLLFKSGVVLAGCVAVPVQMMMAPKKAPHPSVSLWDATGALPGEESGPKEPVGADRERTKSPCVLCVPRV